MINIAFIHNRFPAGGAERITLDIAQYLIQNKNTNNNYKIHVFTTSENKLLLNNSFSEFITINTISNKTIKKSRDIENLVKKLNIDILVQVVDNIYDIAGIKKRTGVKLVFANHGEPFWQRYSIIARRQNSFLKRILWKMIWNKIYPDNKGGKAKRMAIERSLKIYNECDAYTVLCESYKQETCSAFGINPGKSHIFAIENPERIRKHVNYEKDNIILFCGRLDNRYKRVDRVLRIWGIVQDKLNNWKLEIVGDGPDRQELESLAIKLHLKRIYFKGEHKDVQKYYDRSSILVLTSQSEGWPLCLTEAQASGVIPIAFSCSAGVREVINHSGKYGFTVEAFDEHKFAETLIHVTSLPKEEIKKIRHNAVCFRSKYTPDIIAEKWKQLFDSLSEHKD
ncbi:glycosyltransferase [uncultured Bacteroides sp.]|uniref:glycosyltransferase n=1 Tax=uncultured Bacteroides sp. TaxID=162156 RepID=UPI0025993A06|nr:glycosyltransferase [uncultured Bacteroides sp.]